MRLVLLFSLAAGGCLGDAPASGGGDGGGGGKMDSVDSGMGSGSDASAVTNDLAMRPPDLSPPVDLFPSDLAGMTNCYGVAICDQAQHFCIKFHDGSQAAPGGLLGGPACYEPADTCLNLGQPMNCACIQADATLGTNCQGSCLDHMDGTYECFKLP